MLLNVGFIPLMILPQHINTLLVYCPNECTTLIQTDIRTEPYLRIFEIIDWDTSIHNTQDKLSTIEIIAQCLQHNAHDYMDFLSSLH